jgi:hypothetical protein
MSLFGRLFGRKDDEGGQEPPAMPWDRRPSILEFINTHAAQGKPGMTEAGYTLPDEERVAEGSQIRWAPGAMDGVMTHHLGKSENTDSARKTVELVLAYSRQPTVTNKAAVYQHVIAEHIVSIIDPVIQALVVEEGIDHRRLYELARSFVTESPDREPVKFGIAILALFRHPGDQELFQTPGRHDEFTLFCAVALANASEDHDRSLWALARNVAGWGRIHVVERLAETSDPQIKGWLLREGYRNSVMYEYLAGTCARAGGLLAALGEAHVDRELLTSSGEIIQALITGGPAEGIDDYEDARPVIESFLGHMASSAETVQDFLHVSSIRGYLDEEDSRWKSGLEQEWPNEVRESLRAVCDSILSSSKWPERIRTELAAEDDVRFYLADQAAKWAGIDTWDRHWERLVQRPSDPHRWFHVMALCDDDRIGRVVNFAEEYIGLEGIATGAGDELGFGKKYEPHSCLSFVLQGLGRFPGWGARLIEAGLRSLVVGNRNTAVAALAAWPREVWPEALRSSLGQAVESEPDAGTRDRMRKALEGEPLTS